MRSKPNQINPCSSSSLRLTQLEIGITVVGASWVNAMLVGDDLPELGADLVTALAGLEVDNFSHRLKI